MQLSTFYLRVLRKLGVLAAGQSASAEDVQTVTDKYAEVWAELDDRQVIDWYVTDDIPDERAIHMINIVAGQLTDEFSLDDLKAASIEGKAALSEGSVTSSENPVDGVPVKVDYL